MGEEGTMEKERTWKRFKSFLKDKQPHKYVAVYSIFIWWNFFICLLPIIATSVSDASSTVILSSFLAYCFTTLAITLFTYLHQKRETISLIIMNFGFLMTASLMVLYMFAFFMFNYDQDINLSMSSNMGVVILVAFLPMFVATLLLSTSFLNDYVLANKSKYVIGIIASSEKSGDKVIDDLNKGGM